MKRAEREDQAEVRGSKLIALVKEWLPVETPGLGPAAAWELTGPALLARQAGTLEAIFALRALNREADAFILLRSLYEHAVTFAWLAASPGPERHERFLKSDAVSRLDVDKDCQSVGVAGLFSPGERRKLEKQREELPKRMPTILQRAELADDYWTGRISGLVGSDNANSYRGLYAIAYRKQSSIAHPTLWGLNPVVEYLPDGLRRIGIEERDEDSHGPFTMGPVLFSFSLFAACESLGWPERERIGAVFGPHG